MFFEKKTFFLTNKDIFTDYISKKQRGKKYGR